MTIQFVSAERLAKILDFRSRRTIFEKVKRGELPRPLYFGRSPRFDLEAVLKSAGHTLEEDMQGDDQMTEEEQMLKKLRGAGG